jgi:protein involved in polysaccharide export with SLBB domain
MLRNKPSQAVFALLLFLGSSTLFAQSTYQDTSSDQQSTPNNCDPSDPSCAQNTQNYQNYSNQQTQQTTVPQPSQMTTMQTLGSQTEQNYLNYGNRENGTSLLNRYTGLRQNNELLPPDVPTEFQRFVAASTGQMLPIYGASLFHRVPSTFSPYDLAPASPNYVIQPDDELRIRIWGQINYSGNLQVDRSGNIYLPQVGAVHVAGQPFSSLDQHMRQAVGRIFRNYDLSVDLGRIRSMQVYIAGQARRPGVYTVSALSTLVDALFASGGPSPQGSLRHILLKRAGKTIADFDLYELLVHGDKSQDVQLLPEDVLYIPPAGPQVAIVGSIRTPGIYELRDGDTIGNLIDMAGKTSALASDQHISVERIADQQYRQAMEVAFDKTGLATPLMDGDLLRVYPILPAYQKTVILRGNVANPGRFAWHDGMHLSDLIPDRASLVSRDYWWKRSHLGLPTPEFEPIINPNTQLLNYLRQQATSEARERATTQMPNAMVNQPSNNMSSQALDGTGSQMTNDMTSQTVNGTASQTVNGMATPQSPYGQYGQYGQAGSTGSIAGPTQQSRQEFASDGTNKKPDIVTVTTPEINWKFAVIERTDPKTLKTSLISFDLGKLVLDHDTNEDLALEPGDVVTIFSQSDIQVPLEQQTKYVYLEGEVAHAGVYSVRPGETLRDVVRRAGGLTPDAYLYGSEFTRESTRLLQQQRLNEYVQSVSAEAERSTQELAVVGTTSALNNETDVTESRDASQRLISRLSQIRATGRIVLQFTPSSQGVDEVPELALENGDHFIVPSKPATINVVGSVYNQNSFLFQKGETVNRYLKLAGGYNRNADESHAFIIRADGSVLGRNTVRNTFGILGADAFNQVRMNPGDTIVVPDKLLRPSKLRYFIDWTQIFSQVALGAAAINAL